MENIKSLQTIWHNIPRQKKVYGGALGCAASLSFLAISEYFGVSSSRLIRGSIGGIGLAASFACLYAGLQPSRPTPESMLIADINKYTHNKMTPQQIVTEVLPIIKRYKEYLKDPKNRLEEMNIAMASMISTQVGDGRDSNVFDIGIRRFENLFVGLLIKSQFQDTTLTSDHEDLDNIFPEQKLITPLLLKGTGIDLWAQMNRSSGVEKVHGEKLRAIINAANEQYQTIIPANEHEAFKQLLDNLDQKLKEKIQK